MQAPPALGHYAVAEMHSLYLENGTADPQVCSPSPHNLEKRVSAQLCSLLNASSSSLGPLCSGRNTISPSTPGDEKLPPENLSQKGSLVKLAFLSKM
ncbi:hypothetical protein HPG69_009491, partial [Diceros bicornis minor]